MTDIDRTEPDPIPDDADSLSVAFNGETVTPDSYVHLVPPTGEVDGRPDDQDVDDTDPVDSIAARDV